MLQRFLSLASSIDDPGLLCVSIPRWDRADAPRSRALPRAASAAGSRAISGRNLRLSTRPGCARPELIRQRQQLEASFRVSVLAVGARFRRSRTRRPSPTSACRRSAMSSLLAVHHRLGEAGASYAPLPLSIREERAPRACALQSSDRSSRASLVSPESARTSRGWTSTRSFRPRRDRARVREALATSTRQREPSGRNSVTITLIPFVEAVSRAGAACQLDAVALISP